MSYIVIDIEGTKLPNINPWQPASYLCSIGILKEDGESDVWIFNHAEEPVRPHEEMLKEIQDIIDKSDLIIAHNAKFDLNWFKFAGLECSDKKVWCTLVADYLLNGQAKVGLGLNACAARYGLGHKVDLMKTFWDDGYETDEIPLSVHIPYLKQDLALCRDLFAKQLPIIVEHGLDKIAELSFEITQLLSDVESKGVAFDEEQAVAYTKEFQSLVEEGETSLKKQAGVDFNPSTPAELASVLFGGIVKHDAKELYATTLKSGTVKLKTRKCTIAQPVKGFGFKVPEGCVSKKTGSVSVDKNTLKLLVGKSSEQKLFLSTLKSHKTNSKILSTFSSQRARGAGLLSKVGKDKRIHPTFNQAVTATGRLSSSDPNGQNLPRKGTSPIKKVFVSKKGIMVNLDLGQIEWRMAAALSGDPIMNYEIKHNVDVHADNATKFFGAGEFARDSDEFKALRTTAKVMTFRLLYGGSASGFFRDQAMPNYPLARWKEIVAAFYEKYKGLAQWQQSNVTLANSQGYLRNPSGRFLTFGERMSYDGMPELDSKQIFNYPVQSCSADIMYLAMHYVNQRVKKAKLDCDLVLQVHDSMVFDCKISDAKALCGIGIDTFEELPALAKEYFDWDIDVPLTGDAEIGWNYGSTREAKRSEWDIIFNNVSAFLDK